MRLLEFARKMGLKGLTLYTAVGSGSCPMACKYCFLAKSGRKQVLPISTLHYAIDFIHAIIDKPTLHFFGTEPIMQFDLIREARIYAPDIPISLTTNGYLLDDEKIDWIARNNVRIYVYSIDGGREHNLNRLTIDGKETWDRVIGNLRKLVPSQGKWITARGTWVPDDYDLVGRYRALEETGVKSITIIPDLYNPHWNEEKVAQAYCKLADYYKGGIPPTKLISQALDRLSSGNFKSENMCKTGYYSWGMLPNGDLMLCHNGVDTPTWRIGNIFDLMGEVPEEAIEVSKKADNFAPNFPQCQDCPARRLCMGIGWCAKLNFDTTGDPITPPESYCIHLRGFATGMRYWLSLRQRDMLSNIQFRI